jgi:FAD/FMN-containing dehydrogenase
LNRYNDYDIANLTVGVESGLTLAEIQAKLAGEGRGYFIPLDPPAFPGGHGRRDRRDQRQRGEAFPVRGLPDFILGMKA